MDFSGELFGVVLVVFYLVLQILGARKKKQQQRQKSRPADDRPESSPALEHEETELDEALREIRRALGFPDEQREAAPPTRAETTLPPIEQPLERPSPSQRPLPSPQEGPGSRTKIPADRPTNAPREPYESRSKAPRAQHESRAKIPRVQHESRTKLPPVQRESRTKLPPVQRESCTKLPPLQPESATTFPSFQRPSPGASANLIETPAMMKRGESTPLLQSGTPRSSRVPQLVSKLQNPSSAREAVLLKEILDRPLSMRRRR